MNNTVVFLSQVQVTCSFGFQPVSYDFIFQSFRELKLCHAAVVKVLDQSSIRNRDCNFLHLEEKKKQFYTLLDGIHS